MTEKQLIARAAKIIKITNQMNKLQEELDKITWQYGTDSNPSTYKELDGFECGALTDLLRYATSQEKALDYSFHNQDSYDTAINAISRLKEK